MNNLYCSKCYSKNIVKKHFDEDRWDYYCVNCHATNSHITGDQAVELLLKLARELADFVDGISPDEYDFEGVCRCARLFAMERQVKALLKPEEKPE